MSVLSEAAQAIVLGRAPDRIALYEAMIEACAREDSESAIFKLKGKGLEQACKEHAQNLMNFSFMLQECKTIEDVIRLKVEEVEGDLYKTLNENNGNRALGTRDIGQYIKGHPRYVTAHEILLEVTHVKRQLEEVVETLKSMGWTLGNIVKIRVAQLEDVVL